MIRSPSVCITSGGAANYLLKWGRLVHLSCIFWSWHSADI